MTEDGCAKCGFRYNTWHVCVDTSKPVPLVKQTPKKKRKSTSSRVMSVREGADIGRKSRWEQHRAATRDRDDQLRRRNANGEGVKKLAHEYGMAPETVRRIIRAPGMSYTEYRERRKQHV